MRRARAINEVPGENYGESPVAQIGWTPLNYNLYGTLSRWSSFHR